MIQIDKLKIMKSPAAHIKNSYTIWKPYDLEAGLSASIKAETNSVKVSTS